MVRASSSFATATTSAQKYVLLAPYVATGLTATTSPRRVEPRAGGGTLAEGGGGASRRRFVAW